MFILPGPDSDTSPLSKRKRCESPQGESPLEKEVLRSSEFWFEDGSVVLQAENTQFRVHRTILSAKSIFFRDMFMLPPQPDDSPLVEGCPLVVCVHDLAKDWTNVLMFIYHSTKLEHEWGSLPFEFITSMLRLGKKYQMDLILQEGRMRLEEGIPTRGPRNIHWWTCWTHSKAMLFPYINLAQEVGLQAILPMCYFACVARCTTEELVDGFISPLVDDSASAKLNLETRKLLLSARDEVLPAYRSLSLGWLTTVSSDFAKECQKGESCRKVLSKHVIVCGHRFIYSPKIVVDFDQSQLSTLLAGLCRQCYMNVHAKYDEGMDKLWDKMPGYFGLPDWKDLEDFVN